MDILIITLCLPSLEVDGFDWNPKSLTARPTVGEGPCHTDGADGVELVCIVENLGFESGRFRLGAKAMGRDGPDYPLDLQRRMIDQDLLSPPSGRYRMVDAGCLGLPATNVVEQRGCSHDVGIGILSVRNALGKLQHAEDVIEVVHGVLAVVKTSCFSDGDHTQVSDALELLAQFLVD
jgi:hypothetical protein